MRYTTSKFNAYYKKVGGVRLDINTEKRYISIYTKDNTTEILFISGDIKTSVTEEKLFNTTEGTKTYFVAEDWTNGENWLTLKSDPNRTFIILGGQSG